MPCPSRSDELVFFVNGRKVSVGYRHHGLQSQQETSSLRVWPVWVETPSNQGQEARDWEPVYFGLFYSPPGSGRSDKALGVKTGAPCHRPGFQSSSTIYCTTFYKSLHFPESQGARLYGYCRDRKRDASFID